MVTPITITGAIVRDIRFPTSDDFGGSDAMNTSPDYSASYVELKTTQAGLVGHGFTFTIGTGADIVTQMVDQFADKLVGRSIDDMPGFMADLLAELTQESGIRWLGPEKGVTHLASAAILNAVWDLWARLRGVPVWKLLVDLEPEVLVGCLAMRHLGDALTPQEAVSMLAEMRDGHAERIEQLTTSGYPAYITSAGWLGYSDDKVARLVREALQDGFKAIKLKVGGDLGDDRRRASLVRDIIGDDLPLMLDANQVWEVPQAIDWVNSLRDFEPYWIEEPTSPDDILGHRRIAEAVAPVRVATGEHAHNRVMFKQFLSIHAIDVCQIDACRLASINENVPVLLMAKKFNVPVCPHAGGVGLCELVQHLSFFDFIAVSGSVEGRWIEYVDHLHDMFVDPVSVRDGSYQLPTAAGFNSQMTPEAIAAYAFPAGSVWQDRTAPEAG